MEYYVLMQDERMKSFEQQILNYDELKKWVNMPENPKEHAFSMYVVDEDFEHKDWMERPITMVSDELKKIYKIYQPDITWELIVLSNIQQLTQRLFWIPEHKLLDCLSPRSEWHKNGVLKKMVIEKQAIGDTKIFRVRDSLSHETIVDLDVAECLLKFNMTGFRLQRVETESPESKKI